MAKSGLAKAVAGLLLVVLFVVPAAAALTPHPTRGENVEAPSTAVAKAEDQQWPWGNKPEPFPWLDYLANMTNETNVRLIVITRHENTLTSVANEVFLNSPVAEKLGISQVTYVRVSPTQWVYYIQNSRVPIDVAWGGGPTLFNLLDQYGLLEPLNPQAQPAYYAILYEMQKIPDTIAGVPTYKVGDDGYVHWVGSAISSFGFTINTSMIQKYNLPTPKNWSDLTRPEFGKYLPDKPLVGIADPRKSTSNTRMYEIILQAYGWDKGWKVLTLLAANSKIYDSSSGVRDAVIIGEIAVGITIDFYGYIAQAQSPYCKYILPEGETIVNADPIAIIKGTPHPVQAAGFVAWVLSEYGGQSVWLNKEVNRLPINPKVFNTTAGQERPDLKEAFQTAATARNIEFNETLASRTEAAMKSYFAATLVEAHEDLQNVWALLVKAYLNGSITKEQFERLVDNLTAPIEFRDPLTGQNTTFTLEYAEKINDLLISNASILQTLQQEWTDAASAKYLNVYDQLVNTIQKNKEAGTATGNQTQTGTTPSGGGTKFNTGKIAVIVVGVIIIVAAAYVILKK
ncbi:MAG: ABC transporter substrate-binding protein [Desulfurococcales archaeon]|nr:ABC transporter substrate-binding protein [Desulfurococcales archaeon]